MSSKKVSFTVCNGDLTLLLNGKNVSIPKDHIAYNQIKEALKKGKGENAIQALLNVQQTMMNYVGTEKTSVIDGQLYYEGEAVHSSVNKKVQELMKNGFPFKHMIKFLDNVKENPSYQSQQELFDFLDNAGLYITEDGYFLAYKAVGRDYMDKFSHTIDNTPVQGRIKEISMDRARVDDNRDMQCSKGLHVGGLDYVGWYGNQSCGDRLIIVKIHPRDAVSVPKDSSMQKLRVCKYGILYEYEEDLRNTLYNETGEGYEESNDEWDDDEDWDDFDEEDNFDEENDCECECDCDRFIRERSGEDCIEEDCVDDDCVDMRDVSVTVGTFNSNKSVCVCHNNFGIKPPESSQAGRLYYNKRNRKGRFSKEN